jgi:hypothetical protein
LTCEDLFEVIGGCLSKLLLGGGIGAIWILQVGNGISPVTSQMLKATKPCS